MNISDSFRSVSHSLFAQASTEGARLDEGKERLTPGSWIGIGFAILVFVILIALLVWFMLMRSASSDGQMRDQGFDTEVADAPDSDDLEMEDDFPKHSFQQSGGTADTDLPFTVSRTIGSDSAPVEETVW
jgi:hypothetical protein